MAIASILAIMVFFMSIFSLNAARVIQSTKQMASQNRSQSLTAAAAQVDNWYVGNAANIDSQPGQVTPPALTEQWPVTVLMSNRLVCSNGLQAHEYALVLPGPQGIGTTMNVNTGVVSINNHDLVQVVNGCNIEFNLATSSKYKAQTLTDALENYFKAQALESGGGTTQDFFTSSSCNGYGDIPCTTGTTADTLETYLGVGDDDCRDAWGNYMYFDNDSSSVNAVTPPFTARVGFNTPWGTTTWLMALQPS